jgi:nucleotide-binding universal stress UspA family protein
VLIPLDGSPEGEEAIEHAGAVARGPGAELVVVYVVVPTVYLTEPVAQAFVRETEQESEAASYLGEVAGRLRGRGFVVDTRILRHSQPARAILSCAEEVGAELIAMETHGRGGLTELVMGSVSDKVVRASPVPVLVHRPHAYAASSSAGGGTGERRAGGPFHL